MKVDGIFLRLSSDSWNKFLDDLLRFTHTKVKGEQMSNVIFIF